MFAALAWIIASQTSVIRFEKAVADERLNRVFSNQDGWIGADGAFSVPISRSSSWWLFSDTWIGSIRNGSRTDATIVNNTVGRLDEKGLSFIVRRAGSGKAQALVSPREGLGWFWLGPGVMVGPKLYVLLSQVVKIDSSSVFGFKQTGLWLGVFKGIDLKPSSWKLDQFKVPFARFDGRRDRSFGFNFCRVGSWMYIYGTDEDISPSWHDRYLTVARCPVGQLEQFSSWRFWTGTGWSADSAACARTVDHMASDGSVSYLPRAHRYVLVYSENGLSPRILARTSSAPEGPWSPPTEVYRCPEGASDKKIYCYQARNHPELAHENKAHEDELVMSYCTNSFDFWQVVRDASLYFPRFVRVPVLVGR